MRRLSLTVWEQGDHVITPDGSGEVLAVGAPCASASLVVIRLDHDGLRYSFPSHLFNPADPGGNRVTTTPLDFLRATLDAAQAEAESATRGPWEAEGDDSTDDTVYSVCEDPDLVGQQVAFTRGPQSYANMVHIAANSPAAVLRRIAADRKLIAECEKILAVDGWEYDDAPTLAALVIKGIAEGWGWTEGA